MRSLIALALAAALLAVAAPAAAMEDPFIVCITEPCGPQPSSWVQYLVGTACNVAAPTVCTA